MILNILLLMNVIILPVTISLIFIMIITLFFHPFIWRFLKDFGVENLTDQALLVTPIGISDTNGKKVPIPIYIEKFCILKQSYKRADFEVLPGKNIKLYYDYDDVEPYVLVIKNYGNENENENKLLELLITQKNTLNGNLFQKTKKIEFIVEKNVNLPEVQKDVYEAYREAQIPISNSLDKYYVFSIISIISLVIIIIINVKNENLKRIKEAWYGICYS